MNQSLEEHPMKLSRLIRQVSGLDAAASSFVSAQVDKRYPGQSLVPASAYVDLVPAPQRQELRDLLRSQSSAAVYMLLTLWRLGRGDFPPDGDLLDEYLEVGDNFPHVHAVVGYLTGKQLPRYFDEALRLLKEARIDVDGLLE
jgi:hypothetical protein